MAKQYKVDEVANLVSMLKEKGNIILTNFSGIKVKDISVLRRNLRDKDADYKVVKNNLFIRALKEAGYDGMEEHVKGPIGVAFVKEEVGEMAKVLRDFGKDQESFSFSIGVVDKVVYLQEQVKRIADLPPKEVLLAQVMSLINGPATGIALGMNQIMASLARGIKAVAEATHQ